MADLRWDGDDFRNEEDSSGSTADLVSHSGKLQQGYNHGSLTQGLVAYYPMEKGEGGVVHDGALGNLAQIKGAAWKGNGNIGANSLEFNGSSDYVRVEDSASMSFDRLTVSAWFKRFSGGETYALVNQRDSSNTGGYVLQVGGSDYVDFHIYNNGSYSSADDTTTVSNDTWYHFAGTYDGSTIRLYRNGSLVDSTSDSGGINDVSVPLDLGAWETDNREYLDGRMDDVRIYSRALSQPEIEALAGLNNHSGTKVTEKQVPGQNQGGVSRYSLNGDATDSWGSNDGSNIGTPQFNKGVYGQAVDLDGSSQYVETVDSSSLDISGEVTVSVWAKIEGDLSNNHMAVSKRYDYNGNIPYEIQYGAGSGGRYKFNIHDGSQNTIAEAGIDDNDWHHILGTFDGEKVRIYRDGSIVEGISRSNSIPENNVPVYLGVRPPESTGSDGEYFNGKLEDVRIYGTALTPQQVEKLYNKGAYRISREGTLQ